LEIVADILTADSVQIDPGDSVSITQWGGDVPLEGHVSRIEPAAFTKISALGVEEQRVNVVIELDDAHEKWGRLGDGFRVEVDVTVWEGDGVLKAPVSALFRDGESWAVFLVEEDRAQVRRIEIEHRNDFEVEVTGGITPGEVVIVHPSDNVAAGVLVETR
jgi:HlyD family secretion protein